ncbi:MAG: UDP-3-O-acyl-N-acetylglucosamine deacetylase [Phycisphaerales bacterium]
MIVAHPRRTLARPTGRIEGVGLFSGKACAITLEPSATPRDGPVSQGLRFLTVMGEIVANVAHQTSDAALAHMPLGVPARNTTLARDRAGVTTVEHVLAALAGLGVTDAIVRVDGPEIPILDGSAVAFVEAIRCAGLIDLSLDVGFGQALRLDREVRVEDAASGASIVATPHETPLTTGLHASYELVLPIAGVPTTSLAAWEGDADAFFRDVASARTFSLEPEARALQSRGLFTHVSPRDLLVLDSTGTPIDNALRFDNEPARHKLLDLVGDLALLGMPLLARVEARRSGHALTHILVRELLKTVGEA